MEPKKSAPEEGVIRCPAVRSLVKGGKLQHADLHASVQELVRIFSGQNRDLAPNEPGSLANVAGFFAIVNHGVPEHTFFNRIHDARDAATVAAGKSTTRRFDLRLFGSRGDHPGTVNFFKNDSAGEFQAGQFHDVMQRVSDGATLTIQGIARMIIMANDGAWDRKGSTLDLAKSSGEWALMVCALRADDATTDISVADLERMYREADSTQLLIGTSRASARDWVKVTSQIAATIAAEKHESVFIIAGQLHFAYGDINHESGEKLCPCITCNPAVWP
jgi:hypothetical protein